MTFELPHASNQSTRMALDILSAPMSAKQFVDKSTNTDAMDWCRHQPCRHAPRSAAQQALDFAETHSLMLTIKEFMGPRRPSLATLPLQIPGA
jgi:hypothetical protein